ncbi:V-type proton ATPase subunit e1 [Glycine max]|nr:V-type proton ATPase subunit e1 [Glycine max]
MGFLVTTLIFVVIGIIACLCTRICCNRGPSTNLFHLTLVITATICCWMMWAIVYLAQMKPLIGGAVCISCWIMAFQLAFLLLPGIGRVTDVVFSIHSFHMSVDNDTKYVFW